VYDIASHPNDEQVPEGLIKNDFGWYPEIGAAQDYGKGVLAFCNLFAPVLQLLENDLGI
jgi:hypothetical protein